MMINVENPTFMIKDICNVLNITEEKLKDSINSFSKAAQTEYWFDVEIFNKQSERFLNTLSAVSFEKIYFCHLTRSIATPDVLLPIQDLLTSQNDFSTFLKNHNLLFKKVDNKLSMIYDGRVIPEKEIYDSQRFENNHNRLAGRLGFCGEADYCVNGFAFAYNPKKSTNGYYNLLNRGPELLQDLDELLGTHLCDDYCKSSKYYYAICKVPLQQVIFDGREDLNSSLNRTKSYLSSCFEFLAEWYSLEEDGSLSNLVLRMDDYTSIKVDHYFEV